MRIVSLALVGFLAFSTTAVAGAPGWPSYAPRASYMPGGGGTDFDQSARKVTAQRAANMINGGDCKGALRMVLRERDYVMADRILEACHVDKAGRPI